MKVELEEQRFLDLLEKENKLKEIEYEMIKGVCKDGTIFMVGQDFRFLCFMEKSDALELLKEEIKIGRAKE